jgi:hypothetical protein
MIKFFKNSTVSEEDKKSFADLQVQNEKLSDENHRLEEAIEDLKLELE